ncbi:hypothetical protein Poly51_56930 [Rubripirellula tenax]|uniref:ABC transmembrane type-1 domain-containing protein n=1 Tax=Rubripirellula tenax TaxID=2528015 RepID=A0A5C6EE69_9BACT|nr:hypothetical protein [Rubripirellula tenax]TWU46297.1 hypothetical protein Poly51_56930 [Rubripirellula tenax]
MAWFTPLMMTLQLMAASVAIAAIIGIVGAWAGSSLQLGGRSSRFLSRLFFVSMTAAAVMPMILHATAWEATAGKFGWWLLTQTGSRTNESGVYGFFAGSVASVWIHGMVGASLVTIATWFGVTRISPATVAQSRLDFGPVAAFFRVQLPLAAPWWIASLVATAALAATEMTVVDLYGYRTIADQFYLFYAMDPSTFSIIATCMIPLATVSTAFVWMFVSKRNLSVGRLRTVESSMATESFSWQHQSVAAGLAAIVVLIVAVVPIAGLVLKTGQDVIVKNDSVEWTWSAAAFVQRLAESPVVFASEFQWTIVLASLTASAAVVLAWPAAAIATQRPRLRWVFDAVSILMICIPGPIIGLAVVRLFQFDALWLRTLYQQTLLPTVMSLSMRAVPVAYWVLRARYQGIDRVIFESAAIDCTWWQRIWKIDRSLISRSLVSAWLAVAVISSGDVPATLPVIPAGVTTVSVRLFGLLHSGARYQESSLAILYVTMLVVLVAICFRREGQRRAKMVRGA